MQSVIVRNEGFRRQFLVDDKGSTLIVVFGVPPFAHENDAVRAVTTVCVRRACALCTLL